MDKYAIISNEVSVICDKIKKYGYKLIYTDCVDEFISYEKNHADMQCILINERLFVLKECTNLQNELTKQSINFITTSDNCKGKYPDNIKVNALFLSNKLIGKIDSIDSSIIKYCNTNNIELINVKQGYTACSCAKVCDKAIITADKSIYNALKNTDIDVLLISPEGIDLFGAKRGECGFIGGASALVDKNTILFFGDITKLNDYDRIVEFSSNYNVHINYIKETPLTDIGSCVMLNF